ncbi:uncharacterized protein BCR38DRAFT_486814 [Pseudomassariella vexata]|uniref:FAD-binding domain-containing protein n=1 Tax=Pseudomassariella vexata TaxID=1141098 RepID=A0A1Y2DV72_9PEZI|nr:uncharacterized protein BCR38DRAFT_486814 [Pseudomassariella vexata]ORY62545.1 hypothetical protein BCR38DRAFT_486814 [Pseudomassariella vexata]
MPLNILIVGASVAGPTAAMLLQGSDPSHNIIVVERHPHFRAAGQQVDLRTKVSMFCGRWVSSTLSSRTETGLEVLDAGPPRPTSTTEDESMRGDVVKVLYETSLKQDAILRRDAGKGEGGLTYEFGKTVTKLTQNDNDENNKNSIDVTFSDGRKKRHDLVIAADGQGSRTRRLAFGQETSDAAFKSLGVHATYYSIPRAEGEGEMARAYSAPESRMVITRTSGRPVTQVLLFTMKDTVEKLLAKSHKQPIKKQKEAFSEAFKDVGWQTDRVLAGMQTCDDFMRRRWRRLG